jgi:hypothetical protein
LAIALSFRDPQRGTLRAVDEVPLGHQAKRMTPRPAALFVRALNRSNAHNNEPPTHHVPWSGTCGPVPRDNNLAHPRTLASKAAELPPIAERG